MTPKSFGSGSFFTLTALAHDGSFLASSAVAVLCATTAFGAAIFWNLRSSITVYPLTEVARFNAEQLSDFGAYPISDISTSRNGGKLFEGYEIKLVDICGGNGGPDFSTVFSDAFRTKTAKLMIGEKGEGELTVADADFNAETCNRVRKNPARYKEISVVFDDTVPARNPDLNRTYYLAIDDKGGPAASAKAKP